MSRKTTSATSKPSKKKAKPSTRAKLVRVKDLALLYLTKGIPGVAALPTESYSSLTCRKTLVLLREQGHNVSALEKYFSSAKGVKASSSRGISSPQVGDVREYKVQQPKPESRFLIQLPVDTFNVYKGDSVFVHFDSDRIIISPSPFPNLSAS